jgi:hypothetical protein
LRVRLIPLFAQLAWAQPATQEAGTICQDIALATVRSVGLVSARHLVSGHESLGRFSSFCSLGLRGTSHPLWWLVLQVRALLWSLITWSAYSQRATVLAGTTFEGDSFDSIRLVGVGSENHCGGGH